LGDGYVEALRSTWDDVPETADLVMYWWHQAAWLTRRGWLRRFGLITTNSLRQTFNRRVLDLHMQWEDRGPPPRYAPGMVPPGEVMVPLAPPLSIAFAIPDHPWVDSTDGADVRIAMTVAECDGQSGVVAVSVEERPSIDGEVEVRLASKRGEIHSDLMVGARVAGAGPLAANQGLCFQGMNLVGKGFRLDAGEVVDMGYDRSNLPTVLRRYGNARDFIQGRLGAYVVDFFGLTEAEARSAHPRLYQHLVDRVKPERSQNNRRSYRDRWWIFGEPRPAMRRAWTGLSRIVVTAETAKHRVFAFESTPLCVDHKLYAICSDDLAVLGVLSSRVHAIWALRTGGRMGVGNDPVFNNTRCFLTFPFPVLSVELHARVAGVAHQIEDHRRRQQSATDTLTLTAIYNVLEQQRRNSPLTEKEKSIHEKGLVSVLRELHDELDRAVFAAYGWNDLAEKLVGRPGATTPWPEKPPEHAEAEEELLTRLVALNAERAAEEKRGLVRWLRPEFQNPQGTKPPSQDEIDTGADEPAPVVAKPDKKIPWPKSAVEQARAVADALVAARSPLTHDELAARFTGKGPWKKRLPVLLDTLVALGRAHRVGDRVSAL